MFIFFNQQNIKSFCECYILLLNLILNIYYRIEIRKNYEKKITIRTRYNYFKCTIMYFKLVNVFVIFETLINRISRKLMNYIYI